MQVTLDITEKQLDILKELVTDEIDNDCPNTRDECNDLYKQLCGDTVAFAKKIISRFLKYNDRTELVTHMGAHNVVMAENFVKYYKEDKDVR